MRRSIITLALLTGSAGAALAQTDTLAPKDLQIQVQDRTLEIETDKLEAMSQVELASMIAKTMAQMARLQESFQRQQEEINAQEESGALSAEEAEAKRGEAEERLEASMEAMEEGLEAFGESFAARMEEWAEDLEARFESWEEEADAAREEGRPIPPMPTIPTPPDLGKNDSSKSIVIDPDGVRIEERKKNDEDITWEYESEEEEDQGFFDAPDFFKGYRSEKVDRTKAYFDIHFGWNLQLEEGQYIVQNAPGEQDLFRSTAFSLGAGAKTRLGSPYSKFYVKYGIDFSWHNFRLQGREVLSSNDQGAFYQRVDSTFTLDRNKYHVAYLNVPIMFQMDFSEPGHTDNGFTLGLGGYAGFRLNTKRVLEYSTPRFRQIEEKAKTANHYFINQVRYGLMAQIGFGNFKITGSYDLNPFFSGGRGPSAFDYQMASLTVGLTF